MERVAVIQTATFYLTKQILMHIYEGCEESIILILALLLILVKWYGKCQSGLDFIADYVNQKK